MNKAIAISIILAACVLWALIMKDAVTKTATEVVHDLVK